MKTNEIYIRDPFVFPFEGTYYLYGTRGKTSWGKATGFDVYTSTNLENWEGSFEIFHNDGSFWADEHYWAPEVHFYQGAFYLFASFSKKGYWRGTQILKSDSPKGPFLPHSDRPLTPQDQWCIDGTFYVSKVGTPYMVYQREVCEIRRGETEIIDDEMCAVQLSKDLKNTECKPFSLFAGSDCPKWMRLTSANFDVTAVFPDKKRLLIEAPFLYRASNGKLLMTWSGLGPEGYMVAVSYSDNGELDGKWIHNRELFFQNNGGHGMTFRGFDGTLYFTLHHPNNPFCKERPQFLRIRETETSLVREN